MPASSEKKLFINDGVTVDSQNSTENEESVISLLVKPPENIHFQIADFTYTVARYAKFFLRGTRVSPLKEISDWLNAQESTAKNNDSSKHIQNKRHQTVFWLTGDAGTGKSIISSKVLQLHHDNSLVGWHFCSHANPLQNSSIAILESVSGMMASKMPAYRKAIFDLDPNAIKEARAKNDSEEFYRLLYTEPLNAMEPPKDINGQICQKLIIIDALDEIDDKHLDKFLTIVRAFSKSPPWLKIFITSRRYDKILKALSTEVSYIFKYVVLISCFCELC